MTKRVTRLFTQFQPDNYKLELEVDKKTRTFTGSVRISGRKAGRPSQRITLHGNGLKVHEAKVLRRDKKGDHQLDVSRINYHKSRDEIRLHFDELLYPGHYYLELEFSGNVSEQMNGIYISTFAQDNKTKHIVATQFESHYAREAFPCIDEPEAKATFDLTLVTGKGEAVIANTPIISESTQGDRLISTFDTTPKMSTYLLAFVHGELGFKQAQTREGTLVRVYATPENVAHTAFALDCAVNTLEFYNEYFDIPYPLEKCDFIALPDFSSGAMENWGCITFREQALLVDPKNTSLHFKQYVANVIAHELTHQWFGNLVTMRWWTDLWLNESFASWMSYLAQDVLYPEWGVWTQFIVDEQNLALRQDALEYTHPIQVSISDPDEIRTIFDAISYEKGASVILMLHDYLGAKDFRDGLRLYLKRHSYGNTDTTDLWAALEEVSKKPVGDFMGKWTSQSGYPIVTARLSGADQSLHQERFYLNPKADKEAAIWPIPLHATNPIGIETLTKASSGITNDKSQTVLNHRRTSFMRVIYDHEHLKQLARGIEDLSLHELDRLAILDDAFEAAKAGYGPTVDALELLQSYANETSAVAWDIIAASLGGLRNVMDDDDVIEKLKPFVREITLLQFKRLGWDEKSSDNHFDRLMRPTILGLASFGENPDVVDEARRRFNGMTKPEDIHPDIRGVVYGTMARIGGKAEFDKMIELHNSSTNSEERVTLSGALTGFKQPELIHKALAMISSKDVRPQDATYWIAYSFSNRHAKFATWDWMIAHWNWLETHLGSDLSFSRMPVYAARGFSDLSFIATFKEFFDKHTDAAFERPINQALETITWQAAWKSRDLEHIRRFFS